MSEHLRIWKEKAGNLKFCKIKVKNSIMETKILKIHEI
jgi:hypothetical protein